MLKWKLDCIRSLVFEYERLCNKDLAQKMSNSRDYQKRQDYRNNLEECKLKIQELLKENLIESLPLSKAQKEVAKSYYYKAKSWEQSFANSPLLDNVEPDDAENCKRIIDKYRKNIERTVKIYYK